MPPIAALIDWRQDRPIDRGEAERLAAGSRVGQGARADTVPGAVLLGAPRAGVSPILADEVDRVALVADCRLDNRESLRRELGLGADAPDTLLLLRGYLRWGTSVADRLVGDFACVVWDWGRRRLLGLRDRLGVRPLFYASLPHGMAVASSVEALVALSPVRRTADDQLVIEHLLWEYESTERTFWSDVRRLPGGCVLEAGPSSQSVRRYWFPPERLSPARGAEVVREELRALLFQSVRRRLVGDGPLLAHLSGGVDSSSIVCMADQIHRQEGAGAGFPGVVAVSARYPGLPSDEGPYIEAVTRSVSLPAESWNALDAGFQDLDDPSLAGPGLRAHRNDGSLGEFAIAQRLGAGAILSGQGGDHLGAPFGVTEERARQHPIAFVWRTLLSPRYSFQQRRIRARFLAAVVAPQTVKRPLSRWKGRRDAPAWFLPRWRELAGVVRGSRLDPPPRRIDSLIEEAHWRELTSARLGHALDGDQHAAAAFGVEMRYPFLDQDLVDFVLRLPLEAWPRAYSHVRLHRDALGSLLPPLVRERTTKAAFSPVVAHRMRQAAGRIQALFFERDWASARWIDRREAQRLLARALSGHTTDWQTWQPIWAIATLEAWIRCVLE